MTTLEQGWTTMSSLPQELLSIKHTHDDSELYAHHGCARGGVGVLLATGARAGLSRLPQGPGGRFGHRPVSSGSVNSNGASGFSFSAASSMVDPSSPRGSLAPPIREWEKGYGHVNNFQAACRSARTHDVPSASRWSGISFYENNPAEIKRHLDITKTIDQVDVESKLADRAATSARRSSLALQQREAFRRQRLEQAVKYVRAGLPPRASTPLISTNSLNSHASHASTAVPLASASFLGPPTGRTSALAKAVASLSARNGMQSSRCFSAPASMQHRSISLPPPSFHKVYDRIADEKVHSSRTVANEVAASARAKAEDKSKADIDAQVQELDEFDNNLLAMSRKMTLQQLHVVK